MRILWNKWLTVLKKCNWKAAVYGKMRNAVFPSTKLAVASLIILAFIVFITVAPFGSSLTYEDTDWNMMSSPPTMEGYHFFGTDASVETLLVRTAIGGRISLLVGIAGCFHFRDYRHNLWGDFRLCRR